MTDSNSTTTISKRRGRPAGTVNAKPSPEMAIIQTVTGMNSAALRSEITRLGTESIIARLKGQGIDVLAIQGSINASRATGTSV